MYFGANTLRHYYGLLPMPTRSTQEERDYGIIRNPLIFVVEKKGFEPSTPALRRRVWHSYEFLLIFIISYNYSLFTIFSCIDYYQFLRHFMICVGNGVGKKASFFPQ